MRRFYILIIILNIVFTNIYSQEINDINIQIPDSTKNIAEDTIKIKDIYINDSVLINEDDTLRIGDNKVLISIKDSIAINDSLAALNPPIDSLVVKPVKTIEERVYEAPANDSLPLNFYNGDTSDTLKYVRVPSRFLSNFYVFTWKDYNCSIPSDMAQDTTIVLLDRIKPLKGDFSLYIFRFGSGPRYRDIIASISSSGELIDWIEAGAYYDGDVRINVREWEITRLRNITVTELVVFKPTALLLDQYADKMVASRRDTQYTLSNSGSFRKRAYIKYKDKEYDRSYVTNTKKFLKDGKEIALPR